MEVSDRKKLALELFNSGYNCAQSVLISHAEKLGLDKNSATNITSGFGGGMGGMQETCGAVTGAYMVFSYSAGLSNDDNFDKKDEAGENIRSFKNNFILKNKSTNCKELTKCDFSTIEGTMKFEKKRIKSTVCEKCISDSIEIIDEFVFD